MTKQQAIEAVNNGKRVHWASKAYEVIKDKHDTYLILCTLNNNCVGLSSDYDNSNGFFIGE